jgi:hypothetical protein
MSAEDVEELRRLQALFCQYLDDGNLKGTLSLFTDDCIIHSGGRTHEGREAVTRYLENFFFGSTPPDNKWAHVLSDGVYEFKDDGVTAEGRSYMTGFRCSEIGRWWLAAANRHHDRFRKVNGQWLFAEKGMEARGTFRRTETPVPNPISLQADGRLTRES